MMLRNDILLKTYMQYFQTRVNGELKIAFNNLKKATKFDKSICK